ncbi:MAG: hypothetical protein LBF86_09200 [Helicobacteraceae bacterium]|nr:hypothetical protein [Helicobacteraceae bacterium]
MIRARTIDTREVKTLPPKKLAFWQPTQNERVEALKQKGDHKTDRLKYATAKVI